MEPVGKSGIFDLFIPGVKKGDLYKFAIETKKGDILFKADPYGNECQMRPETASVVTDISDTSGEMNRGRRINAALVHWSVPCPFMKFILGHGKRMRAVKISASGHTVIWLGSLQIMSTIWDTLMWNLWESRNIHLTVLGISGDRVLCANKPLWQCF